VIALLMVTASNWPRAARAQGADEMAVATTACPKTVAHSEIVRLNVISTLPLITPARQLEEQMRRIGLQGQIP
jgi:hypothetical protein